MNSVGDSSSRPKDFKETGVVRSIGKGGQEIIKVPMDPVLTKTKIEPELIDNLTKQIEEFLHLNSSSQGFPQSCINLPLINSGGGTYASTLRFGLFPTIDNDQQRKLGIFLEREEDISAGTIAGQLIPEKDLNSETIRANLVIVLTKSAKLLASRANLRAGYDVHLARQGLQK